MSVDEDAIGAYGRATNEEAPDVLAGRVAPPVFAIVPVWAPLQAAAEAIVPEEARGSVVHGDQDIFITAPIEPGMKLTVRAAAVGVHVKPSGTTVVLKTETRDENDVLLNEQYVTEFYRGVSAGEGGGETAPDHRLPDELAGSEPDQRVTYTVDEDQTFRYAEASGDDHAIHLDDEVARAAGLPGIVLHGLCLMAFAARAVLDSQGLQDPALVRRLAVRFSRPMAPGGELTILVRRLERDGAFGFDAVDGEDTVVLKDGLVELGESRASS